MAYIVIRKLWSTILKYCTGTVNVSLFFLVGALSMKLPNCKMARKKSGRRWGWRVGAWVSVMCGRGERREGEKGERDGKRTKKRDGEGDTKREKERQKSKK